MKKELTAKEWYKILVDEKEISEDDDPLSYLIILGALENGKGAVKKHVKAWIGNFMSDREKDFEKMWNIAIKQKIFVKGKIPIEDLETGLSNIELSLYSLCLKGLIERGERTEQDLKGEK